MGVSGSVRSGMSEPLHRPGQRHPSGVRPGASGPDPGGGAVASVPAMSDLLVIVGGGNMGAALLGGLLAADGADPAAFAVSEALAARRDELAAMFPGVAVAADVPPCAAAVIAVKPGDVAGAVRTAVAAGAATGPVDRRRRADRRARGARPARASPWCGRCRTRRRSSGRARRRSPAGPRRRDDDLAWAESDPRRRRHGRARRRAAPRRGDGADGLRPGVPVPRRRGARRRRRRAPGCRARWRPTSRPSCSSARPRCSPTAATPARCGRW